MLKAGGGGGGSGIFRNGGVTQSGGLFLKWVVLTPLRTMVPVKTQVGFVYDEICLQQVKFVYDLPDNTIINVKRYNLAEKQDAFYKDNILI